MASSIACAGRLLPATAFRANESLATSRSAHHVACPCTHVSDRKAKNLKAYATGQNLSSLEVRAGHSNKGFLGLAVRQAAAKGAAKVTCRIDVGDTAPDFTLKDQNNRDVSLSRFKGRPVVLYFYPKDDTPGCTKQACFFRDSYDVYKKAGAEVVGISSDPPESHKAFAEKHNLPYTLLTDKDAAVRKEYGIKNDFLGALPGRQTYLLDQSGVVKLVYNNQFMPEKHVSETLRVIETIKPEQRELPKELRDLPKAGLGMIGKIFQNPEQISRKKEDDSEPGMIGKIFKNPEQIPRGGKKTDN